jgi:sec-independent protein translocase protein TatA
MFRQIGAPEIILILLVLVLLFGAKKLPDLSRSMGRSLRIFKAETKGMRDDDKDATVGADGSAPGRADDRPRAVEGTVVDRPQDGSAATKVPGTERDR